MVVAGLPGAGARVLILALLVGVPLGNAHVPVEGLTYIVAFQEMPPTMVVGSSFEGAEVVGLARSLDFALVEPRDPVGFLARTAGHPDVRYVEANLMTFRTTLVPDDPRWTSQYAPQQVGAPAAWDTSLGNGERTVCIVDTGVRYTHEDLAGPRFLGGWDFVKGGPDPWDDNGHGTHVAGIAAAGVNNGVGMAGMANVGFLAAKALDSQGSGSTFGVASAIAWCADNGGDVISMSLGSPFPSQSVRDAVAYAWDAGSLLVGAAGNSGPCNNCVGYPAAFSQVIAVTCTSITEEQCIFSSDGGSSELAAPGQSILSSYRRSDSDYVTASGTSMSTPAVSGIAALVWGQAPQMTNSDVRALLRATARDVGQSGWDAEFGYGIVDAAQAMAGLVAPLPPQNLAVEPQAGAIQITWSPPADGGGLPVANYIVYRGPDEDSLEAITQTPNLGYVDSGLGEGQTFTYAVSAANGIGESDRAGPLTATTPISPEAAFTWSPTAPAPGGSVRFTDLSTDPDGTIAGWLWDFGDGGQSALRSPTHTFSNHGTFLVRLTVTDSTGLTGTATASILVNHPPDVAFSINPVSPTTQDEVDFFDASSDQDGLIVSWNWDFGDGTTSTSQHPSHRYVQDGTYTVTLRVTDNDGVAATASQTVTVANVGPTATFTYWPAEPTTGDVVAFIDNSTDVDGSIVSWNWDFGDGTTSTDRHPTHQYADDGSYLVVLTVQDDDDAVQSATRGISVTNLPPVAAFSYSPDTPATGALVTFADASTDADGLVVSWHWDFGDGTTSNDVNPSHRYADDGTYMVTLTVTDDDGASTQLTQAIVVRNVEPVAGFTMTPAAPTTQDIIQFTDTSTDSDGYVAAWHWDFGDGTTSTERHPTHRYPDDGAYAVTLVVTDDDGARDDWARQVTVANVPPVALFSYAPAEPTTLDDVRFSESSSDVDGVVVSWAWDFGDGTTSNDRAPVHRFPDDGHYTVTLTVTDDDGDTGTMSLQVMVTNVLPTAAFSHSPLEPQTSEAVQFTDASNDVDGTIVSWSWDMGDGTTSTQRNPVHHYAATGTYTAVLTVTDDDGGQAVASTDILVVDPPSAPSGLSARPGPGLGDIELRWTRSADNGGAPLLGNHVYRSSGGAYELVATIGNVVRFVDHGRQIGTIYSYEVVTFNRAGESPASNSASAPGTGL